MAMKLFASTCFIYVTYFSSIWGGSKEICVLDQTLLIELLNLLTF